MRITITVGPLAMEAELNDTPTARKVTGILPFTTSFSTWGDEIYFPHSDRFPTGQQREGSGPDGRSGILAYR